MQKQQNAKKIELSEVPENLQEEFALSNRDFGLVKNLPIHLDVEIGTLELSLEKLFSIKSGEVLTLQQEVDAPVAIKLKEKTIALGNLVAVDGFFGVEITHIED